MQRDKAKLLRGFCKVTQRPYRAFKKAYYDLSDRERNVLMKQVEKECKLYEREGLINHKKYYDLKRSLDQTLSENTVAYPELD